MLLEKNRKIYIVLTQTGTVVSRLIKKYTKAPYNHASITSDENLSHLYSFSRYYAYSPLPAGFNTEFIDTCVFGSKKIIPCEIYSINVTEEQLLKYNKLMAYFSDNKRRYSFNLLGFLSVVIKKPIPSGYRMVCSHFVAYTFKECGICSFNKSVSLVTPDD